LSFSDFGKKIIREILERENFLTKNFGDQKKFQAKKESRKNFKKKNSRIFSCIIKKYSSEKIKGIQKKIVEKFLQKKTGSCAAAPPPHPAASPPRRWPGAAPPPSAPWPAAGEERRAGALCSVAGCGGGEA